MESNRFDKYCEKFYMKNKEHMYSEVLFDLKKIVLSLFL